MLTPVVQCIYIQPHHSRVHNLTPNLLYIFLYEFTLSVEGFLWVLCTESNKASGKVDLEKD